jgi:signal transduction histidine kinase
VNVEEILRTIRFLHGLSEDDLGHLAEVGETQALDAGVVFREGDPGDKMYVLLEGAVKILRHSEHGEVDLADLQPGAIFGELALLDGGARSASARATEPSKLFSLERSHFLTLMKSSTPLLENLLREISARVRSTNQRYLDQVLLKAESEVEKHRSIAEMVVGVAHEINTPLGIVTTAATLIADQLTPKGIAELAKDEEAREELEDLREAADLIQSHTSRATRLVASFKRLSANQISEVRSEVDLASLVGETTELFGVQAKRGIHFEVQDELPDNARTWTGYAGHLTQILLHFFQNVERYAYPEEEGGGVRIHLTFESEAFVISVADRGRGIRKRDTTRLFNAFFTTGRSRGSTGLGLAIVHNLVTALQGTIKVDSEIGAGTTMTVTLPQISPEVVRD